MSAANFSMVVNLGDFFSQFLLAQATYGLDWRMHPMSGWGWGFGMMAMMLMFWGAVIFAGVIGLRWFIGQTKQPRGDSAMRILRDRFARGEIEKDEFEAKKKELS
jgi:putative membrane protein